MVEAPIPDQGPIGNLEGAMTFDKIGIGFRLGRNQ